MSEKNLNLQEVLSSIRQKKYHPVYLLHGDEPFFIDKISDFIEKNVLTEAEKSFNQVILYGRDTEAQTVTDHARRFPMMSLYQVVIIREAQDMRSLTQLQTYVENPSPTTILVICHKHKKLDMRSAFAKALKEKALVFESKSLYDNQVPDWIKDFLKEKKLTATGDALFLMAENMGNDLSTISNELEKLIINLPENAQITVRDVEEHIGISKDYNIFEMQKALSGKDLPRAFKIAAYFKANPKNNPLVVVISSLYGFFSKVLVLHATREQLKRSGKEVHDKALLDAMQLKSEFLLREYKTAAQHYSKAKTISIIGLLKDCDLKSKGVNNTIASSDELLTELLFKVLN